MHLFDILFKMERTDRSHWSHRFLHLQRGRPNKTMQEYWNILNLSNRRHSCPSCLLIAESKLLHALAFFLLHIENTKIVKTLAFKRMVAVAQQPAGAEGAVAPPEILQGGHCPP